MFAATMNVFATVNSVVKFNGLNYADWSEQVQFTLRVMGLDLAIVMERNPTAIAKTSSENDKSRYETWEWSNRLNLNLMRMIMTENIKPSMLKTKNIKEFILKVKEHSQSDLANKSIVGSLMSELTTKKFDWSKSIHDHMTEMSNLAAKFKTLGMDVSDSFLI